MLVEITLRVIMFLVRILRGDHSHYILAPDDIFSKSKVNRIMSLGHSIPSVIITVILVLKVLPRLSDLYEKSLAKNASIIPFTMVIALFIVLVINGFVIEFVLEKTNAKYREFKAETTDISAE